MTMVDPRPYQVLLSYIILYHPTSSYQTRKKYGSARIGFTLRLGSTDADEMASGFGLCIGGHQGLPKVTKVSSMIGGENCFCFSFNMLLVCVI